MSNWPGPSVWRHPAAESTDLFPGLVVHDQRVSGSITLGKSRLPMWAFISWLPRGGWAEVEKGWDNFYGWDAEQMGAFLYWLMEQRGEFARLLLVLADVERREHVEKPWWDNKVQRKRVVDQLRRCVDVLTDGTRLSTATEQAVKKEEAR